jgi:hypothetical protein
MQSDMHYEIEVDTLDRSGESRRTKLQPRDIPHLFLGTVDGLHHSNIYILFPRLYVKDRPTNFLTDEQAKRFNDGVMTPACTNSMKSDRIQHYPLSHHVAELNARAKGAEQRTQRYGQQKRQFLTFPLPAEDLAEIWDDALQRIDDPRYQLRDFQSPILLLNTKGTKLDHKVDGSLVEMMLYLERFLSSKIDFRRVERAAIDIGAETCPVDMYSEMCVPSSNSEEAQTTTMLWKTCCLQKIHGSLASRYFGGSKGTFRIYNIAMLRDAACMSIVPPKKSKIFRAGLLYG